MALFELSAHKTSFVSIGGVGGNRRDLGQYSDGGGAIMKSAGLLILGCLGLGTAVAQSGAAGFFNPLSASRDGIHLYGVSIFGGYFSGGTPFGIPTTGPLPTSGSPVVGGGSANFGWSLTRGQSSLVVSYTPSILASPNYVQVGNLLNNTFSLNWNRKLGPKWSLNAGVTAAVSSLQETYFSLNAFGQAASLPTTFDGLAGAVLSGTFTDPQLASALTGASARLLPEQTYLYGQRFGSASARVGVTYRPTGRSSFHASIAATRTQSLDSGQMRETTASSIIPQTTAGTVSFGWAYALSSRTHFGLDASTSRTLSRLEDGYANNAGFSIGRTMSEHWFVQGRAGAGVMTYLRQTVTTQSGVQYTAGGSIGYKLRSHTLLASFDRSLADSYGLGSTSTDSAMAGWAWKAPGSLWSLSANFGYQRLNGGIVGSYESWRASGGIARALNQHTFISVQYAYFTSPANLAALTGITGAENALTVGLSWSPSLYR